MFTTMVQKDYIRTSIRYLMRVVLDYGGVLVDHIDEREFAHLLGVSPSQKPYPGVGLLPLSNGVVE